METIQTYLFSSCNSHSLEHCCAKNVDKSGKKTKITLYVLIKSNNRVGNVTKTIVDELQINDAIIMENSPLVNEVIQNILDDTNGSDEQKHRC